MSNSDVSFLPRGFYGEAFLRHDPLPIGGVAVALMLGTTVLLDLPLDAPLLGVAFCGTALLYLADRTLGVSPEDRVNRPRRQAWARDHWTWICAEAILLGMGIAVLFPLLQWRTIILTLLLGGVGLLHVLPVLPGHRRLKSLGSFKPVVVAATWAVGAVVLPLVESDAPVTFGVGGLVAYRFLFILPNVLLADWADREGDAAVGLGTWAMQWSRRSVQVVSTVLIGMAMMGAVGAVGWGAPLILLLDAFGGGLMAVAVWGLRPGAEPLHVLWLDLIVGWPGVVWLLAELPSWGT